jgi:hypothetical protein
MQLPIKNLYPTFKIAILIAYLSFTTLTAKSQDVSQDSLTYKVIDNKAELSSVIQIPNTPKDLLFEKAKEWIYKTYKSGDAVIDIADAETSKIIAQGISNTLAYKNTFVKMDGGRFKYSFTIYAKDNKVKLVIDDISHEKGEMVQMKDGSNYADESPSTWGSFGASQSRKQWVLMKKQAYDEFNIIYHSFKTYLTKVDRHANF